MMTFSIWWPAEVCLTITNFTSRLPALSSVPGKSSSWTSISDSQYSTTRLTCGRNLVVNWQTWPMENGSVNVNVVVSGSSWNFFPSCYGYCGCGSLKSWPWYRSKVWDWIANAAHQCWYLLVKKGRIFIASLTCCHLLAYLLNTLMFRLGQKKKFRPRSRGLDVQSSD